eukprot:443339_1
MELCPHIIHLQNNNVKYEIIIMIIIHIKTSNITRIPINVYDILSNITNYIIHNRVNNLYIDTNCIIYDTITTNILNEYSILINTTIYTCDKQKQSFLTVDFTQHLQSDFINIINNATNNKNKLLLALNINTSNIKVRILNMDTTENIIESTTILNTIEITKDTKSISIKLKIYWIIGTITLLITTCIFCMMLLIVWRKCYVWKYDITIDDNGGSHSISIMAVKAKSISIEENSNLIHRNFNVDANNYVQKRHKESESLIIRYPGDDHEFKKRYESKYNNVNKKICKSNNNNPYGHKFITPGYKNSDDYNDEINPNLKNDQFIIYEKNNVQSGPGSSADMQQNQ